MTTADALRAELDRVRQRLRELGAVPDDHGPYEAAGRLPLLLELERGRVRTLEALAHVRR